MARLAGCAAWARQSAMAFPRARARRCNSPSPPPARDESHLPSRPMMVDLTACWTRGEAEFMNCPTISPGEMLSIIWM